MPNFYSFLFLFLESLCMVDRAIKVSLFFYKLDIVFFFIPIVKRLKKKKKNQVLVPLELLKEL